MRAPRTLREIEEVARLSAHPERLRSLIRLIEEERGYELYRAVSAVKAELGTRERDAELPGERGRDRAADRPRRVRELDC